ncbi:hypothetical protein LX16_0052 [Stackebrandtia albiflava]|uniref:Uncharacterized protein n=2 Tax=Stackebrandtia albiflava TaxID=406432 RepID=A0A562VGV5_9ACTN|nr:hypothetical protein LX16_0052 [Stackebrandtia albiflava]
MRVGDGVVGDRGDVRDEASEDRVDPRFEVGGHRRFRFGSVVDDPDSWVVEDDPFDAGRPPGLLGLPGFLLRWSSMYAVITVVAFAIGLELTRISRDLSGSTISAEELWNLLLAVLLYLVTPMMVGAILPLSLTYTFTRFVPLSVWTVIIMVGFIALGSGLQLFFLAFTSWYALIAVSAGNLLFAVALPVVERRRALRRRGRFE